MEEREAGGGGRGGGVGGVGKRLQMHRHAEKGGKRGGSSEEEWEVEGVVA